jgi:hypothetical protein
VVPVARFVVWVCALEALWIVFVGAAQSTELVAGLIASAVVAVFVEVLRGVGLLGFRVSPRTLREAWSVPAHVAFDFVLVLWLLVRETAHGRRVRGRFVTAPFEEEPGPRGRFRRALTAMLENESANGMVVDIDDGRVLLHSLDTRVSTGKRVL